MILVEKLNMLAEHGLLNTVLGFMDMEIAKRKPLRIV